MQTRARARARALLVLTWIFFSFYNICESNSLILTPPAPLWSSSSSSSSSVWSSDHVAEKASRLAILPFVRRLFGYYTKCESRSCPPWKCQDDSAVIHGYCCRCPGWQNDQVPVPCHPELKCPIRSESLCSDYNYMMECCCTGL